jgi:predicted ATPase
MFQITLLGSMSVGKTTLLNLLKQDSRTKDFVFIPESATQIIETYNQHPSQMNVQELSIFQQRVLDNQIKNEQKNREKSCDFVSDRGVIDGLSYSIDLPIYSQLKQQIKDYLVNNPYTNIIYLPIEFNFDKSGRAMENCDFQKTIDDRLRYTLNDLNLDYTVLTGESIERKEQLINHLFKQTQEIEQHYLQPSYIFQQNLA